MHRCTISHIDPDSPLRHAAHPGDRLVSINGNPITDVLVLRCTVMKNMYPLTLEC